VIWSTQPELGPDISPLALRVAPLAPDVLRVKIGDPGGERWEVPAKLFGSRSGACSFVWSERLHTSDACCIAVLPAVGISSQVIECMKVHNVLQPTTTTEMQSWLVAARQMQS